MITFSGNGEPTLHPDFAAVVKDTLDLRDRYFPDVKVSVLTNSTRLDREDVVNALKSIDNNILKLDSAVESTMRVIDRPTSPAFTVDKSDSTAETIRRHRHHTDYDAARRIQRTPHRQHD